jgi:hypothetical protein
MAKRTVNSDKLNNIFDLDESNSTFFSSDNVDDLLNSELTEEEIIIQNIDTTDEATMESAEQAAIDADPDSEYINTNLKEMIVDVKDIIAAAKYLIDSSPDEHTIVAASTLFTSAVGLLKELNKGVLQSRKERHALALEKLKIDARMKLVKYKADLNPLKQLGSGNTINIDNRQVNFSQESVIQEMVKAQKQLDESEEDK